jgi:hypothetical protein
MLSKYRIVLSEIYNQYIHGDGEPMINSHYLIIGKFNPYYESYYSDDDSGYNDDDEDEEDDEDDYDRDYVPIEEIMTLHNDKYRSQFIRNTVRYKHPFIRNYRQIVLRPRYIQPEIAECIILPTGESVAILKTFWIRIIQRAWKRVLLERAATMKKRSTPGELYYRQTRGKWSCVMPGLCGMLHGV